MIVKITATTEDLSHPSCDPAKTGSHAQRHGRGVDLGLLLAPQCGGALRARAHQLKHGGRANMGHMKPMPQPNRSAHVALSGPRAPERTTNSDTRTRTTDPLRPLSSLVPVEFLWFRWITEGNVLPWVPAASLRHPVAMPLFTSVRSLRIDPRGDALG